MKCLIPPCKRVARSAHRAHASNPSAWPMVFPLLMLSLLAPSLTWCQEKASSTVDIYFPNYSYPDALPSFSEPNMKNAELIVFGENGAMDIRARLRKGLYERHNKEGGGDAVKFEWVKPIGKDPVNANFAVACYTWVAWMGSSSDIGVVQLLQRVDGHLRVAQQILFNLRGSKTAGAYFDVKSSSLKIRGVHGWEHCCPTELDLMRFHFDDGLLKQVSRRKVPFE
jgi:hypothetical protein